MSDTDTDFDIEDENVFLENVESDKNLWEKHIKDNFPVKFEDTIKELYFEGRWLYWPQLCEMSPARMISFLKSVEETAVIASNIIVSFGENKIPQSYLHWWCHTYFLIINDSKQDIYPVLGKTLKYNYISEWNKLERQEPETKQDDTSDSEIELIAIFELWLEILFLDITLYNDEKRRKKVPRLRKDNEQIVWHNNAGKPYEYSREYATRLETLKFILRLGSKIFSERGYVEGVQYWDEICKKFSILG